MKIILGSSSPRRKKILGKIVKDFDICHPEVNEEPLHREEPLLFAKRISREKNDNIKTALSPDTPLPCLIITCDTIVTIDNMIIGKPSDYHDARDKLSRLSGRSHQVMSGLTLCVLSGKDSMSNNPNVSIENCTNVETTNVVFRDLSDETISGYLDRVNCMDKAGAYAIQQHGDMIIERIEGSLSNVIGFPLRLFYRQCSELNITEMFIAPQAPLRGGQCR